MREIKNTGIPWIGKIPEDWKIRKVKDLFVRINVKAHQENPTVLSLARSGVKIRDISNNEGQLAESYYDYNLVQKNDLLINPMDLYSGANCSLSLVDGVISPAYINLRAREQVEPRFFDYFFKTQYWSMVFFAHGKGVSFDNRWTLSTDTLLRYLLPVPSYKEQLQISSFLDEKCSEIDSLISLQDDMIAKLQEYKQSVITEAVTRGLDPSVPMKDSGVEWIGMIPDSWNLIKMNNICNTITDFVASGSFASLRENVSYLDEPNYAMLVRTTDLSGSTRSDKRVYISESSYKFLSNSNLFGNEIILPNIGASVGDVYLVPEDMYPHMSLAPNSIMIRTNLYDKYYYYYFCSKSGQTSILDIAQSTAQAKFNKTELRNLQVCVPSLEEQHQIADFLDCKCSGIDSLIDIKKQKIEALKEYKKSLIYECVTGKKEIA